MAMTTRRPVCLLAIFSAVSFASVPLLQRKALRRPCGASDASAAAAARASLYTTWL